MPFHYAYYRFGSQVMTTLPSQLQRTVRRFRQLYDMGLHGPVLFLYPTPLRAAAAAALLKKYRGQSGKLFFERVGRMVRLQPTEGSLAYLYGVLAHYALRSLTTPYLSRQTEAGTAARSVMETEFDRYLLELDGKGPAHLYDRSGHIRLTPGECGTVAAFYPPASSGLVEKCTHTMAERTRFLTLPKGLRRDLIGKALSVAGPEAAGLLMPTEESDSSADLDAALTRLYEMALQRYAVLADELQAYLRRGTPLGTDFSAAFY